MARAFPLSARRAVPANLAQACRKYPDSVPSPLESAKALDVRAPIQRNPHESPSQRSTISSSFLLRRIETFQVSRRISKLLHMATHAIHHGQEQIAHRSFLAKHDAPAGLDVISTAACNQRRQIRMQVRISIREARAVNDHRIVQNGTSGFRCRPENLDPFRELSGMVRVDLCNLVHQLRLIAMVCQRMMAIADAEFTV